MAVVSGCIIREKRVVIMLAWINVIVDIGHVLSGISGDLPVVSVRHCIPVVHIVGIGAVGSVPDHHARKVAIRGVSLAQGDGVNTLRNSGICHIFRRCGVRAQDCSNRVSTTWA